MNWHIANPNTGQAMSDLLSTTLAHRFPTLDIEVTTSPCGPASLEGHADEALAVPGLLTRIIEAEQQHSTCRGHVVACFGDPGLGAAREVARHPVIGMAEAAMASARLIGGRFSVITTLARTVPLAQRLVREYGHAQHCGGIHASGINVLDLDSDPAFQRILEESEQLLSADQSDVLILGCAGMAPWAPRLQERLGRPVVDGVSAGLQLLVHLDQLGLSPAKQHDRALPINKPVIGPHAHLYARLHKDILQ